MVVETGDNHSRILQGFLLLLYVWINKWCKMEMLLELSHPVGNLEAF